MAVTTTSTALPVHRCAYCGDAFTTAHPGRRFCSVRCGRAWNAGSAAYSAAHNLKPPAPARPHFSTLALLIDAEAQQQLAGSRPTSGDWIE